MRSISGLYFILRIMPFLIKLIIPLLNSHHVFVHWYTAGSIFLIVALIVALARPYRKAYMNRLDTLILSDLALVYFAFSCGAEMLLALRTLLAIPIVAFIIVIIIKIVRRAVRQLSKRACTSNAIQKLISLTAIFTQQRVTITPGNPSAAQPLIEPTSTILSYGTCTKEKEITTA